MDVKSFFKRKAKPDSKPVEKAVAKPAKLKKLGKGGHRTGMIVGVVVLLLLLGLGAAFYLELLPKEYSDMLRFVTGTMETPVQQPAPHAPKAKVVAAQSAPVIPAMVSASGVSAVATVSAVSVGSGVASTVAASGGLDKVSGVAAASAVSAIPDPVMGGADTLDQPFASSAPMPSKPISTSGAPRPRNRDMRHCLELKTNEAIMRCVYPKR